MTFGFSRDIEVSSSQVANVLSTFTGSAFDRLEFDFPVSPDVMASIQRMVQCEVVSAGEEEGPHGGERSGHLLSFSGGFDSMAARVLMPSGTKLVSLDFGGRFGREREFFQRFDALVVTSNIVGTPYRRNSWSFMGMGCILAAEQFRAKYHTFGSILEASPDNFRLNPVAASGRTYTPFAAAGYVNAPYVLGLSEIGTLRVLLQEAPELVPDSLVSLASPGEEKLHRKKVLVETVAADLGVCISLPDVLAPKVPHFTFGANFAVDVLALYVAVRRGKAVADTLVRDMPDEAVEHVDRVGMDFMEKANPTMYAHFPGELFPALSARLAEFGIGWYTESDWCQLDVVRKLLSVDRVRV